MDKQYWDKLAGSFDQDVIEIYNIERNNVLMREIESLARQADTVADLGCGAGGLTQKIAPLFKHVIALDLSEALINTAQKRVNASNVEFGVCDLAGKSDMRVRADLVLCINVLINPEYGLRRKIAENVYKATRRNGHAIIAVPAYESMLHVYHTLIRCRMKEGESYAHAARNVARMHAREVPQPVEGNILLQDVSTKHFMKEELHGFLNDVGFRIQRIQRLELPWNEELESVPRWLKEPYPWDWLAVVSK